MIDEIANLPDEVSLIPLGRKVYAIVDTKNLRLLSVNKWHIAITPYKRYARRCGQGETVYMHREILDAPEGFEIDHINGNGLDNREANLRICTTSQNQQNSTKKANQSSLFKGVDWDKAAGKWRARITVSRKLIYIGRYKSELMAAKAYDIKAVELFGEFANLNFPSQLQKSIRENP